MPSPSPRSGDASARSRRAGPVRVVAAAVIVLSLATVLGAGMATGRAPSATPALDPAIFTGVGTAARVNAEAPLQARSAPPIVLEAIPEFPEAERSFAPRPQPELRQAVGVIVKPTPRPQPRVSSSGGGGSGGGGGGGGSGGGGSNRVSGTASWYCKTGVSVCHYQYPGGLYAAAGPALRVGNWRGRSVRVCERGSCVNVRLIDWCACPSRAIDLYSDAFRRLASLSQGTMRVTITW